MTEITLTSPLDMHLHLRDGEMLKTVAPLTSQQFAGAIVMPNLKPVVDSVELMESYRQRILQSTGGDFTPYMALFFRDDYDQATLQAAKKAGAVMLKLYPAGATTNSESGVTDILSDSVMQVLAIAEELGFVLGIHGETNGFVLDREREFLPVYDKIAETFPKLKVIIEHMSCKKSVDLLEKRENLYATITLHHLTLTLDDLIGGMLEPHHFCKPIIKTPRDRDALQSAALNAHPKVCFGSDSAPHPQANKERNMGAAGIFSAPVTLPGLAELFEKHNKLSNLQAFVSDHAHRIYDVSSKPKTVKLIKTSWEVPQEYGGVVPLFAGHTLNWRIAG